MATPAQRTNTWTLDEWYDQSVAGTTGGYTAPGDPLSVFLWGGNGTGGLAQNNTIQRSSPVQLPGTTWNKLDAGASHSMATKTDGTLWAWGSNSQGGLGQNDRTPVSSPIQVGTDATWVQSSSVNGILAIKTNGTLWSWGYNWPGNLGINGNTNARRSSPTQVGTDTTWSKAVISSDMAIATKTNGTLWVWGLNEFGGCAQNLSNPGNEGRSSPVQVGTDTTWSTEIGVGPSQFCAAIKTNGTLWMWGQNSKGQLAQNDSITGYSSPVQVPGTTWSKVIGSATGGGAEGWYGAIKTDGTLWMWGSSREGNTMGQNQPDNSRYSSPVQVPGTWSSMTAGWISVGATKTNGELWVWGQNPAGALGQNESPSGRYGYSSPVQVPGTWSGVEGGGTPGGIGFIGFNQL